MHSLQTSMLRFPARFEIKVAKKNMNKLVIIIIDDDDDEVLPNG